MALSYLSAASTPHRSWPKSCSDFLQLAVGPRVHYMDKDCQSSVLWCHPFPLSVAWGEHRAGYAGFTPPRYSPRSEIPICPFVPFKATRMGLRIWSYILYCCLSEFSAIMLHPWPVILVFLSRFHLLGTAGQLQGSL